MYCSFTEICLTLSARKFAFPLLFEGSKVSITNIPQYPLHTVLSQASKMQGGIDFPNKYKSHILHQITQK